MPASSHEAAARPSFLVKTVVSSVVFRNMSSEDNAARGPAGTPWPGWPEEAHDDRPHLEVRDPKMMRALAHPMRVALIEAIGQAETKTLTATEASELLDESPANCAFHLRTLAKYGFVEEAGGGRGRQRPWRLRFSGIELAPPWQDPETRLAAEAAATIWIDRWLGRARDRVLRVLGYPAHWQEAAIASQRNLYLTAGEAKELGLALHRLFEPYEPRTADPAQRPPGSLPHEVLVFGYPLVDPDPDLYPDPDLGPGPDAGPEPSRTPGGRS
jgi:predicted transcriptional regulator